MIAYHQVVRSPDRKLEMLDCHETEIPPCGGFTRDNLIHGMQRQMQHDGRSCGGETDPTGLTRKRRDFPEPGARHRKMRCVRSAFPRGDGNSEPAVDEPVHAAR